MHIPLALGRCGVCLGVPHDRADCTLRRRYVGMLATFSHEGGERGRHGKKKCGRGDEEGEGRAVEVGFDKGMSEGGVAALNLRQRVAFVLPGVCITKHTSHKEFVNDTTHSNNTTLIEKKKVTVPTQLLSSTAGTLTGKYELNPLIP